MSAGFLADLARASLEGAIAILVVGAASLFLRGAPSMRSRLWWIACLKLLVGLAGVTAISLPILPAVPSPPAIFRAPELVASSVPSAMPGVPDGWQSTLLLVYLVGAGVGILLTARQLARTRRVLRLAEPVRDGRATNLLVELCGTLGVRRVPALAQSHLVDVPQVVGSFRPTILLPRTEGAAFSRVDLALVLCHELVHVRRRDLLLGWVPAFVSRLFFFHPGAWLAAREYALAREAACDAEVLRALGASPRRYGRLLVEASLARSRALAPAASVSPSFLHLRRRLRMLEQAVDARPYSRLRWVVIVLLAAAVLVPVRLAAKPDRPAPEQGAKSAVVSHPDDGRDAFVFLLDESTVIMSGNMEDVDRARQLRESGDDELLWMRRGDQEYVVRDRSVLDPIRELHASPDEPHRGAREEELARREEELAREQDLLTSEQDALSGHADALSRERELLEERVRGQVDEEVRGRVHGEVRGRVEKLAEEQRLMEAQAVDREREMARLEAMIDELAAEQDRAGAGEDTELQQRIRAILDEAVRSGKARRVRPAI